MRSDKPLSRPALRIALRFVFVLGLVVPLTTYTYVRHGRPLLGVDDANIFFVYADHLASGHGLVYNIGGERVEGFTSLLWVLLCAPWFRLLASPEPAILAMCMVLLTVTHTAVTLWLDGERLACTTLRAALPTLASSVYLVLVFATPAYITWTTITLMDTALWGLLVAGLTLCILRDGPGTRFRTGLFSWLIALALLARPESLLVCPILIGLLWACRTGAHGVAFGHRIGRQALVYLVVAGALTAFRVAYFGYPAPNTFYAKVSPSIAYNLANGLTYLSSFLALTPVAWVCTLLVAGALSFHAVRLANAGLVALRPPDPRPTSQPRNLIGPMGICAVVSAVLLAVPVLGGGDHFAWSRFYQPAYPILVLTLVVAGRALVRSHAVSSGLQVTGMERGVVFTIALAFVVATGQKDTSWRELSARPLTREFELATAGFGAGRVWREMFLPLGQLPSLGVLVAGGIKRSYPGEVIDLLGLNHVKMGHSPGERIGARNHAAFDADVFYELQPQAVVPDVEAGPTMLGVSADGVGGFHNAFLKGLPETPRFQAAYSYAWVTRRDGAAWVRAFFRRDFLDDLRRDSAYRVCVGKRC